ncbi:MAG: HD domain-containing protein [Clostridiales bacterium]|jgi:3'-5' exoribonuclease|nr:HD domain-containing protein [Clostridiales bacterium]
MYFIEDFKENEHIIEHFLCKQKQNLKTRSGKTYLSLRLQDRTGSIDAKVWELNNDIQCFEENEFIKVDGVVLTYQNDLQIKINRIRRSNEGEYDPENYIPRTDKNIDALYQEIAETVKTITNPFIRRLMDDILICNEEISSAFQICSAAKNMHHSYLGGLLEHTLSVTQICDFLSGRYRHVNRDILISTAILHDIAKVYELSAFPENDYTDDGQLLGHLVMGAQIISEAADKIEGFPHQLKSLLMHSILAHHGEYEYGSPKRPKTIEAFILHCADNMDAKIKMFEESLSGGVTKGNWIGYQRILARNIRKSHFGAAAEKDRYAEKK